MFANLFGFLLKKKGYNLLKMLQKLLQSDYKKNRKLLLKWKK